MRLRDQDHIRDDFAQNGLLPLASWHDDNSRMFINHASLLHFRLCPFIRLALSYLPYHFHPSLFLTWLHFSIHLIPCLHEANTSCILPQSSQSEGKEITSKSNCTTSCTSTSSLYGNLDLSSSC